MRPECKLPIVPSPAATDIVDIVCAIALFALAISWFAATCAGLWYMAGGMG